MKVKLRTPFGGHLVNAVVDLPTEKAKRLIAVHGAVPAAKKKAQRSAPETPEPVADKPEE